MKVKFRNYFALVLLTVFCFASCYSLVINTQNAKALTMSEDNHVYYDIQDGAFYYNEEISVLNLDNTNSCIDNCNTHGAGREVGGTGLLDIGCRNYMSYSFNYGATDIPYWIDMSSINAIANSTHRSKILSDIRGQTEMWNSAAMYDGTGQIVNIYEDTSSSKPSQINGKKVIEVSTYDFVNDTNPYNDTYAGLTTYSDCTVQLNYNYINGIIGYNVDTVVHEFGHVLGLDDIDSATHSDYGTHKTLMGYNRGTTAATLNNAIKYQDVQGIAVTTGRHTCADSHFMRYVTVGNAYKHICFYCDRIDNRKTIISGSKPVADNLSCMHDYQPMVSCGERLWEKCTKCYKVTETTDCSITGAHQEEYGRFLNNDSHEVFCSDCGIHLRTESHTLVPYKPNILNVNTLALPKSICTVCYSIKYSDGSWLTTLKNEDQIM